MGSIPIMRSCGSSRSPVDTTSILGATPSDVNHGRTRTQNPHWEVEAQVAEPGGR